MTLIEYFGKIIQSTVNDWTLIACWGGGSGPSYLNSFSVWQTGSGEFQSIEVDSQSMYASLKSDLAINFAWGLKHNEDFVEPWANISPNPKSSSSFIDFFYNGVLVYRDIIVSVDGGRCYLPLPQLKTDKITNKILGYTVSKEKSNFIEMLNSLESTYDYRHYLNQAKIEEVDERWIS